MRVGRRAHRFEDRGGDPLDGLVNMFDIGIVLAVAFLLAALSSLNLTDAVTRKARPQPTDAVVVSPGETVRAAPSDAPSVAGRGTPVGRVYRLRDGRLVVVLPTGTAPAPTPSPSR